MDKEKLFTWALADKSAHCLVNGAGLTVNLLLHVNGYSSTLL